MTTLTIEELKAQRAGMLARIPVNQEEIKNLKQMFHQLTDGDSKNITRMNIARAINLKHRIDKQLAAINAEIKRRNISSLEQVLKAKKLKQGDKCVAECRKVAP